MKPATAGLALFLLAAASSGGAAEASPVTHPRLFVAELDPFAGLPALKARWAAGERPSEDLPGLALSWLLSGDESLARRALEELRADRPTRLKGSSAYVRYLNRSMAFDWLYDCPGFDAALKDQVAADLVAGAERMLALPSLKDPAQASYHNHTVRELALAVFSLAAVEGHPSVEARAAPLRAQAWRAFDNLLEQTELVNPDGAYHESTDYMRITWAPLAMMAEVRRTTTGEDPAARWSAFRNMGTTYLYKVPTRPGSCSSERGSPPSGRTPCSSSSGTTPRSSPGTPRPRPSASCRATGTSAASATSSCATAGARTPPGSRWPVARTSRSTTTSTPRTS